LQGIIENKDSEEMENFAESAMYSEREAKANCYRAHPELRHLRAVLDWLEHSAKFEDNHFTNRITPDNTFHQIKIGKIDLDLNPDVAKKDLHVLDQQALTKFNTDIFRMIRSGDLAGAVEKCLNSGQSFKAAIMEGATMYHNPKIEDEHAEGEIEGVEMRDIWKRSALAFCESPQIPLIERGIIGAVCGFSEPLLQLAKSWEDRLWALLTAAIDVIIEQSITESIMGSRESLPDSFWKQNQPVENLLQKAAAGGNSQEKKTIFRKIQEFLILDDLEGLGSHIETIEAANKHQARFLAHMSTVLQSIGVGSVTTACLE
jgi:hypothetical protein